MIHETAHEICVIAEYQDGGKFCLAKFMHEKDAQAWREQQEQTEWLVYRLYKRKGDVFEEVQWEALEG